MNIGVIRSTECFSSLLCDLIATSPRHLEVIGCEEEKDGRIAAVLVRRPPPSDTLHRADGSPPRGVFDLWDLEPHILVFDIGYRPERLEVRSAFDCVFLPVRTTGCDLASAHEISQTSWYSK